MDTSALFVHGGSYVAPAAPSQSDRDCCEAERPGVSARGALIGMCSGAVIWAGILLLTGIIKL
jgi:hypothetical protein